MAYFISFEGIDGCGKTTQLKLLEQYLINRGIRVVVSREPGGTEVSELIRQVLLASKNSQLLPMSELLLYYASRHQNLHQKVLPALQSGAWVLCDRYADASMAYQGYGRGLDRELIKHLNQTVIQNQMPDLTLLMDIEPSVGISRALSRNTQTALDESRFEQESLLFFERVRNGYLELARLEPNRFRVIPGVADIQTIHDQIVRIMESLITVQ
jgi:dTMP kinase